MFHTLNIMQHETFVKEYFPLNNSQFPQAFPYDEFMPQSVEKLLTEFVGRVMIEKDLSSREVSRRARRPSGGIDPSYVNKIRNGSIDTTPSPQKLQALARGLGVPEDELFDLVRGIPASRPAFAHNTLRSIDFAYEGMPKTKKQKVDFLIEMLDREVERIQREKE